MVLKKVIRFHREHGFKALLFKIRIHSTLLIKTWYEKKFKKELLPYEIIYKKFPNRKPLSYIKINHSISRLNLVVDDINQHLSALILSILFVNRRQIPLRIISRTSENSPYQLINFLKHHNLPKPVKLEFFSDYDRERRLEISGQDTFLATSTCALESLKSLTTTPLLFSNLYCKPAFAFKRQAITRKSKYKLLFYAQESFYRGLEALEKAFLQGIIDPKEWEIHFAGYQPPPFKFSNGLIPDYHKKIPLSLLPEIDLLLCLDDPYKAFEIASMGGVAVTNESIEKAPNIIVEDLNHLICGLESAVSLVKRRENSYPEASWDKCFEKSITQMENHVF